MTWETIGHLLCFGMCQYVRLQISGLGKLFVASVEWTDIWAVASVNPDMGSKIEVQGEPLPTSLKRTLQDRILNQLVMLCN